MSVGPAIRASPHAGERAASPAQARASSARLPREIMGSNLIRPHRRDRYRADGREGLGHEVVDVVESVGHEEPHVELSEGPAGAEIEHLHRHPALVHEALQLEPGRPARLPEVVADAEAAYQW